ncbi:MAG: hypothetical protein HC804_12365, partial [Anaerolineae bacterium]|nr:hypothetical protein [Anaerolineae bacterium]
MAATWLYDEEGNPIGTVGYFRDLRVVEETQQRLNLLLAASNLLAEAEDLTHGMQDLAQMMVTHMEASFCRLFLLDPEGNYLTATAVFPLPNMP